LSLFWASAATLRVTLVAWAPEVLGVRTASDIADLTFFMAVGIVIGAGLVPRLIPLEKIRRARFSAYFLGLLFIWLSLAQTVMTADLILLGIGLCGGIFVVPLNAAIQEIGQRTIGSGSAVAVQNFFQNGMILVSMAIYTYFAGIHVPSSDIMQALGFSMFGVALAFAYRFHRMGRPKASR
jgi:LPLT family lysophospholipid transporter-like MFS transporter